MSSTGTNVPGDLFRWSCLGVAVVFLGIAGWMLNDIRLHVRQSAEVVKQTGSTVNERLPEIVQKSQQTAEVVSKNLPEVVEKVRRSTDTIAESLPEVIERVDRTTEVLADLAEDIRQVKELAGLTGGKRDENLVAYTNSIFKVIEGSGATLGTKKVIGSGLKNTQPAREWVAGRRRWALYYLLRAKSKKEMLNRICGNWQIQLPGQAPVPLVAWLREHHPETRDLSRGGIAPPVD